jgi:pilus assembly protein CpaE
MSHAHPTIVLLQASQERHVLVTWLVGDHVVVSRDLGLAQTQQGEGQRPVVLVDLAGDLERSLQAVERVRAVVPRAQIVALADGRDGDVVQRAKRAGAEELAVLDEGDDFTAMVEARLERARAAAPGGRIVSVFAAKGGVGATTVATNVASSLSGMGKSVLLVDLDRQPGNASALLDVPATYSIADVVGDLDQLDREILLWSLGRHRSGVWVLPQPDSIEDRKAVAASDVSAWLPFVARHFDYVVCDGFHGFDELSVAVLDASHRVDLLLTPDVAAVRSAKRCLEVFRRLRRGADQVALVVNRRGRRWPIDLATVAESLGKPVRTTLADDQPSVLAALNGGVPLSEVAPSASLTQEIARLAADIAGVQPEKRPVPVGLFRPAVPSP